MTKETGNMWQEPESAANEDNQPQYPYNNSHQTPSGHLIEYDDTPGRERIRIQHRTETFIEMHPDGSVVFKTQGDSYDITIKDKNILVKGDCNITVVGDVTMDVQGDFTQRIKGDYNQVVEGDFTQVVKGELSIVGHGDVDISADPNLGGVLSLTAGGHVYVYSDVFIGGEFVADKILSNTRVDALSGVSAGPLGFVSITGGLSVGISVAVPGTVMAAGMVTAGILVSAPLGTFDTMAAVFMTDMVNTSIYNTHFHISPKGPTGTAIVSMV